MLSGMYNKPSECKACPLILSSGSPPIVPVRLPVQDILDIDDPIKNSHTATSEELT